MISAVLRTQARSTAKGLLREVTIRGETLLHEVHIRADTVNQQSRDKREQIAFQQHEQLRQHTEIITALADDHHSRVMRFLHAQLQQWGIHEPAGPTDPIGAERTRDRTAWRAPYHIALAFPGPTPLATCGECITRHCLPGEVSNAAHLLTRLRCAPPMFSFRGAARYEPVVSRPP